jgi:tRNA threonylcarbamoyl adenosine modification protein YeaZ
VKVLFIDTGSHTGTIACMTEKECVASTSVDHRISDEKFVPMVEAVLNQANWTYQDLTQVAVVSGPGGFTSIRVGVASANALAYALSIPITGIQLSDLYMARVAPKVSDIAQVVWLHSTKKQFVFRRGGSQTITNIDLLDIANFASTLVPYKFWTGEILPEHQAVLPPQLSQVSLRELQDVLPEFLSRQNYSPAPVLPWYGRGL